MDELAAASQQKAKPGWDKTTWRVALVMAAILAPLIFASSISPLERMVGAGHSSGLAVIAIVLASLVFAPILSGIARRRTLLWAYFPLLALTAELFLGVFVDSIGPWTDVDSSSPDFSRDPTTVKEILIGIAAIFACPLISAGPVCLYRVLRRRTQARQIASDAALFQAMRTHQEGVWPPAPAQMAQESPAEKGE